MLEKVLFEGVQIGGWIAAKAPHGPTGLLAVGELPPELAPACGIARPEIGGCEATLRRWRVVTAATSRTEPRTTVPGAECLPPVARR